MPTAITTTRLEVRYGDEIALTGVDLAVPAGTTLAVIGPNGSGKSTLLSALAGIVEPAAGSSQVAGSRPALVMQSTDVEQSLPLTVQDTVALARYPHLGLFRRFTAADRSAVTNAMERMAISDLAGRQLHDLSGGQRQRVLVAQGLAQEAEVLLLDEPVTGLDVTSRAIILEVIDDELAAGRTVVITTHHLDDARLCDQVLLLDTSPIAVGPPSDVFVPEHLRQAFGAHFIQVGDELILDDPHHSH